MTVAVAAAVDDVRTSGGHENDRENVLKQMYDINCLWSRGTFSCPEVESKQQNYLWKRKSQHE